MESRRRLYWIGAACAVAIALAVVAVVLLPLPSENRARSGSREAGERRPMVVGGVAIRRGDPLAFDQEEAGRFLRRGSRGHAHVLFALSPGGVEATARRTAGFRAEVKTAARRERVDPLTLEALVFLESAGRPAVMADGTPASATGLTQIIPDTATDLLGMSVDLGRSKQITDALEREERRLVAAKAAAERRLAAGRTEAEVGGEGDRGRRPARGRAPSMQERKRQGRPSGPRRERGGGSSDRGGTGSGRKRSTQKPGGRAGNRDRPRSRKPDARRGSGGDAASKRHGRRDAQAGAGGRDDRRGNRTSAGGQGKDRRRREPPTVEDARRAARRAEDRIARLVAERRRVDDRFDPKLALAGAARYLALAEERFGREDLATASYHMGIGNLEAVIDRYLGGGSGARPGRAASEQVSYAGLYFDSSPTRHSDVYGTLRGFGDDSRHYLFKLEAAREIMRLWRSDRSELERLVELHAAKASAEEVLRPEPDTPQFEDPEELRDGYASGDLARLPDKPRKLGLRVDRELGELARDLDVRRSLYRGLRPEALAAAVYMARLVRQVAGGHAVLSVTSAVRDQGYQARLQETNLQATDEYSLHTTGYSFDVARDLPPKQERAAVFALERLRALNVIDWVYEPGAFHVTVGPGAEVLLSR